MTPPGKRFFLITGLPRSRTAWLANLFCTDKTVCFHDPVATYGTVEKTVEAVRSAPFENVGVADPCIAFHSALFQLIFPGAPVLIVTRDPKDSAASFSRAFNLPVEQSRWMIEKTAAGMKHLRESSPELMEVDFDQLSVLETLRRVWFFCCPQDHFNETRVKILLRMNVVTKV